MQEAHSSQSEQPQPVLLVRELRHGTHWPADHRDWTYDRTKEPAWAGYSGHFRTPEETQRFIDGVARHASAS